MSNIPVSHNSDGSYSPMSDGHTDFENKEIEIWKDIKGYKGYYKVSNMGRVKSLKRVIKNAGIFGNIKQYFFKEKILKPIIANMGYHHIILCKNNIRKQKLIHRLVAQAFLPNPNNYLYVCHKDDNGLNNNIDNLFWATPKMNTDDMCAKNRNIIPKGILNGMAKLNNKQVRVIKYCIKLGMKNIDIAKCFMLNKARISAIKNNRQWKHILIN